jgi:hypothetical protein
MEKGLEICYLECKENVQGRVTCDSSLGIDLQELGLGGRGMDWTDLAKDRDRWRALVNAVMDLRVP